MKQRITTLVIYIDQHHNEKTQSLFQKLLPGNIPDFRKAGFVNVFEIPC